MNYRAILFIAGFLLAAGATDAADRTLPEPNWNRHAANVSASQAETQTTLESLYRLAREGRGDELMQTVLSIEDDTGWQDPAREKVLYSLALALSEFDPGTVGPGVLEYLLERRSRTLVPHEEHPEMGVPLFNIRAAAAGSLAEWARYSNRLESKKTSGRTTADAPDADEFLQSLSAIGGTGTAARVRSARSMFSPEELEYIVAAAPGMHDTGTASLVLAELSPGILNRPATVDLLFSLLNHRELGATAALLLAGSGSEVVFERLAELASGSDSLAEKRAALAIETFQPAVSQQ